MCFRWLSRCYHSALNSWQSLWRHNVWSETFSTRWYTCRDGSTFEIVRHPGVNRLSIDRSGNRNFLGFPSFHSHIPISSKLKTKLERQKCRVSFIVCMSASRTIRGTPNRGYPWGMFVVAVISVRCRLMHKSTYFFVISLLNFAD
jgi:hypothetical protein